MLCQPPVYFILRISEDLSVSVGHHGTTYTLIDTMEHYIVNQTYTCYLINVHTYIYKLTVIIIRCECARSRSSVNYRVNPVQYIIHHQVKQLTHTQSQILTLLSSSLNLSIHIISKYYISWTCSTTIRSKFSDASLRR